MQDMQVLMNDAHESTPLNQPELQELEMTVTELHNRLDMDENTTLAFQQWCAVLYSSPDTCAASMPWKIA
jgi:hypothetical protein